MRHQQNHQSDILPFWMRQAKQEFDWSVLIAIAMSLAIAWPFIINEEIPAGTQLEHYVFQASDIVEGFGEGRLYPRWSPYALEGYGAPIPNYYPMGTAYSIAVIEILFTNDIFQATRIVFMLAYICAGANVYWLVSDRTDSAIGLLASVLYIYSPTIGSTIPYVLGDLPLLIASAILPLSLWSIRRYVLQYQSKHFLIYVLAIAFTIWTHPQLGIVSIIICGAYVLLDATSNSSFITRAWRFGIINSLGVLLVAFYWIPAIYEHNDISWHALQPANPFKLSLLELITPLEQIDAGLLLPQPQFKLGTISILFGLIGLFVISRIAKRSSQRYAFVAVVIFVTCCILLVTLMPREVWLLSPVVLLLNVLGAQTLRIRLIVSARTGRILMVSCVAATIIFSLSTWLTPKPNLTMVGTDALAQIRYERQGYGIATLPSYMPLPSIIPPDRQANRSLVNSYEIGRPIRYDERQNNSNTIVSLLNTAIYEQTYRIFNQNPTTLEFNLSYFSGWQAYVEGEPISTYPNPSNQMITVDVPPVDNAELAVAFVPTQIRTLAWGLSIVTSLIITAYIVLPNRTTDSGTESIIQTLPRTDVRLLLFMFISLGIITVVITSDNPPVRLQATSAFTLSQSLPLQSRTSAGLEASTFELNTRQSSIGQTIEVNINWQALTSIPNNYHSRALLRGADNRLIWYTGPLQNMGRVPTKRWPRNKFVKDTHVIVVPTNVLLGDYEILIEAFPCNDNQCNINRPVIFFDASGNAIGEQLIIPLSINIR